MERIEAQYLNPGDIIAPFLEIEPAVVATIRTWNGAYGLTTELTYRYEGSTTLSTLRTLATRQFTILGKVAD